MDGSDEGCGRRTFLKTPAAAAGTAPLVPALFANNRSAAGSSDRARGSVELT
jgi:hypothetical protein